MPFVFLQKIYKKNIFEKDDIIYNLEADNNLKKYQLSLCKNIDVKTVDFYLIDAFEIEHFLPFYNYFRRNGIYAVFVAEPPTSNISGEWFDYEHAIEILKSKGLDYIKRCNRDAEYAFTTQRSSILNKYGKCTKKVNLNYGATFLKKSYFVSKESTVGFDLKLVHGIEHKMLCKNILDDEKIKIVGYPKYFNRKFYKQNDLLKKFNIKTDKPILLYLPTWDEHASIQKFGDTLINLKEKFYIVVKPHHCTFRLPNKKNDMDYLSLIADLILPPEITLEQLSFIGDLTLIDAKSGATLEMCFLNTKINVIFLSVVDNVGDYFRDDIYMIAPLVNQNDDLLKCIDNNKYIISNFVNRESVINRFFSPKETVNFKDIFKDL